MKVFYVNRPKSGGLDLCRKTGVYGKGFLCYNKVNFSEEMDQMICQKNVFFYQKHGVVKKGADMKSFNKNINELLAKIKDSLSTVLIKARSNKFALPRPSGFLRLLSTNKAKILKAKYSHSRPGSRKKYGRLWLIPIHRLSRRLSITPLLITSFQYIKNISFPKFSFSQLSVPVGFRKYLNRKRTIAGSIAGLAVLVALS